jgi:hypothetical protein
MAKMIGRRVQEVIRERFQPDLCPKKWMLRNPLAWND